MPGAKEKAPTGWGAVAKRQIEIKERKEEMENQCRDFFLMEDESAQIQFLSDEPYCFDAHNVKDKSGRWTLIPCGLNNSKHCVLCTAGVKTTWRAAFKVLDYRGTWDKDKRKFRHDKPVEKIWKVGSTIAQQLKSLVDKKKKPLSELVLEVSRSGSGKDSTYNFEVAYDDEENRIMPIRDYEEEYGSAEELCKPWSEERIDAIGKFSTAD